MTDKQINEESYREDLFKWRQDLDDNLRKEDSWLALAGLYWLMEGENTFGTGPANDFVLDVRTGPERIGTFSVEDGKVILRVLDGVDLKIDGEIIKEAALEPDSSGSPTEIKLDHLTFMLLEREDGWAIRLWDNQKPERLNFPGRRWLPVSEDFRIRGQYHPFPEEVVMEFSRRNGTDFQASVQGEVRFDIGGKQYSLAAFEQGDGSLFILFYDQTSGEQTYSAGRYLLTDTPRDGEVVIDFNRAYHPPCAFTDYATCPLPPAQNRLDLAILAGECE